MRDMLAWMHQALAGEYEFARRLLRGAKRRSHVTENEDDDERVDERRVSTTGASADNNVLRADLVNFC
jgi:hypothetical protein